MSFICRINYFQTVGLGPLDQFMDLSALCLLPTDEFLSGFLFLLLLFGIPTLASFRGPSLSRNFSGIYNSELNALFGWIFTANVCSIFPTNSTSSGFISSTFFASFTVFFLTIILGLSFHGWRFFGSFLPAGTPLILSPFIVLIEILSFLARSVSLGMRLFANLFAGHCLLKILLGFMWAGLVSPFSPSATLVFILISLVLILEICISFLQAYVFTTLSAAYINDAVMLSH